jgi:hypothetical protein
LRAKIYSYGAVDIALLTGKPDDEAVCAVALFKRGRIYL